MVELENPSSLKVLSYNIHKGFSTGNLQFVLQEIRDAIRLVQADLVFLQEVVGQNHTHAENLEDWPEDSQFEFMADEVWTHFAYGRNAVYDHGHHGNAILSKYPIVKSENIDLSTYRLEQRGLLHCEIQIPTLDQPLHAFCSHLGLFERDRKKQIQSICDRVNSVVPKVAPVIMAGDFNDWKARASSQLREQVQFQEAFLETHQEHPRTYPSWLPILRLDRIYYRGFRALQAEALSDQPWSRLSDHLALFAELEFTQQKG